MRLRSARRSLHACGRPPQGRSARRSVSRRCNRIVPIRRSFVCKLQHYLTPVSGLRHSSACSLPAKRAAPAMQQALRLRAGAPAPSVVCQGTRNARCGRPHAAPHSVLRVPAPLRGGARTRVSRREPAARADLKVVASAATAPTPGVDALLHSYRRLQNGSDVRGVALPGVAGQDVTLSADRCGRRA